MATARLPYEFDTVGLAVKILKWVAAFEVLIVIGVVYSAIRSHGLFEPLPLIASGLILGGITYKAVKLVPLGSAGTITTQDVVVRRGEVFGYRLPGPDGRFPLARFSAIRVDRISANVTSNGITGPHERVYLTGDGMPDIQIAAETSEVGKQVARDLCAALGLRYAGASRPY